MTTTKRVKIEKARGYTGARSRKSYVAQILGSDSAYGFVREFLTADEIDWQDSQLFRKPKGVWAEYYNLTPGLYEIQEFGERQYRVVRTKPDGLKLFAASEERVEELVAQLDAGQAIG